MLTERKPLVRWTILVGLVLIVSSLGSSAVSAQDDAAYVRQVRAIDTNDLGLPNPAGLAFSPAANSEAGQVVATRDLSGFDLSEPQGMVFAPSRDPTDESGQMSLYIADKGDEGGQAPGKIVEFSLTQPVPLPLAPSQEVPAYLVRLIYTSQYSPPSPDPAGITYLSSVNELMISDS
jgi:hypothetical protein